MTDHRQLRWTWPVAILLGFPLGGLLAHVIAGRVDSAGAAIAAGLIAGALTGTAQWLALRPLVEWFWIPATGAGMAVGLAAGAALVDYGIGRGDLALMGAVTGAGVGALQALVLARHLRGAVLGGRESAGMGDRMARHVGRDLDQRQGSVGELRRRRRARVRARDVVRAHVPPDED